MVTTVPPNTATYTFAYIHAQHTRVHTQTHSHVYRLLMELLKTLCRGMGYVLKNELKKHNIFAHFLGHKPCGWAGCWNFGVTHRTELSLSQGT